MRHQSRTINSESRALPTARIFLVWGILTAVLFAVYWPTLSYGPVIDDPDQIRWVSEFESFSDVWGTDASGLFRPVKNLAFYLLVEDGDLSHLRVVSLLLFACFGTAYFLFASRFLKMEWALFTALLVVLHPAQVASAVFPSAINNIFSAICILLFCCVAIGFLEEKSRRVIAVLLLILFGGLALLGYELGVVIFPLSVLLGFYFRKDAPLKRLVGLSALSLLLVGIYLLVRGSYEAIGEMTHAMIPPAANGSDLFLSAPYYTLKHLWMAVWPVGQGGILLADDPRSSFLVELPYWIVLGTIGLISLWRIERSRSLVALGLLFFVFAMSPLSNWIPLRNGPITNYYLLVPICGLALALGFVFEWLSSKARGVSIILSVVLLGCSALGGSYRASWWESQYSIYEYTAKNHPDNWVALNNFGIALTSRGEHEAALAAFQKSAALADWFSDPYENRMWLLLLLDRDSEVLSLVENRGARESSSLAAAAAIAYARAADAERASVWAQEVDVGDLKPALANWFRKVMEPFR